jgi:hypothetical protein
MSGEWDPETSSPARPAYTYYDIFVIHEKGFVNGDWVLRIKEDDVTNENITSIPDWQ